MHIPPKMLENIKMARLLMPNLAFLSEKAFAFHFLDLGGANTGIIATDEDVMTLTSNELNFLGEHQSGMGKWEKAKKYFSLAVEIAESEKNHIQKAWALQSLGRLFMNSGDNEQSVVFLVAALKIAKNKDDKKLHTAILSNLASVNLNMGNLAEAEKHYKEAILIAKRNNEKHSLAVSLGSLGVVYNEMGEPDKAIEVFSKSIEIWIDLDMKNDLVLNYLNLGVAYRFKQDNKRAIEIFLKAKDIIAEFPAPIRSPVIEMKLFGNLGAAFSDQAKMDEATRCYEKALQFAEELNDKSSIALGLMGLSKVNQKLGNYALAIEKLSKAVNILEKTKSRNDLAKCYLAFGEIYEETHAFADSKRYFELARDIFANSGDKSNERIVINAMKRIENNQ